MSLYKWIPWSLMDTYDAFASALKNRFSQIIQPNGNTQTFSPDAISRYLQANQSSNSPHSTAWYDANLAYLQGQPSITLISCDITPFENPVALLAWICLGSMWLKNTGRFRAGWLLQVAIKQVWQSASHQQRSIADYLVSQNIKLGY